MGASGSKTAKAAAGSAARKYPNRPTGAQVSPAQTNASRHQPPPAPARQPGPTVKPQPHASSTRDEAINLDASDPDFARSLRRMGAVQPSPTYSPSSTFLHPNNPNTNNHSSLSPGNPYPVMPDPRKNPALMVLEARSRIQDEADKEFIEAGTKAFPGRQFLDVGMIRQVLLMRERGMGPREIEKQLELRPGVVSRLGDVGVVESS